MANIKLFGNTKIQGKAFFDLSESAPEPTYSIEKSVSSVDEGASVTFTLTTTNVANGTSVPYTITGISAADITSGSLTGNFTVNNNSATVTITATADQLTEGAETATLTLDNVADFDSVTVNDTSLTPFSPDQITGLRGWYDYTEGTYSEGGNVSQNSMNILRWENKVGNNGHLEQPTYSLQPIYRGDHIEFTADSMFANFGSNISAARTYYIILKKPTGFTSSILASIPGPPPSSRRNSLMYSSANGRYQLSQGTPVSTTSLYTDTFDRYLILSTSFNGVGTGRIRINDGSVVNDQITGLGNNFEASPILYLGATSGVLTTKVKEILFYEGAHTTDQIANVINYLNAKHQLY